MPVSESVPTIAALRTSPAAMGQDMHADVSRTLYAEFWSGLLQAGVSILSQGRLLRTIVIRGLPAEDGV